MAHGKFKVAVGFQVYLDEGGEEIGAVRERYDVVIDFGQYAVGSTEVLTNTDGSFPSIGDLVQFRVTNTTCDSSTVPATLSSVVRMQASQAVRTTRLGPISVRDGFGRGSHDL